MLQHEDEMLGQLVEQDGLLVMARGLGVERLLQALVAAHSSPSCLLLVVGASVEEASYIITQLEATHNFNLEQTGPPPRMVTADVPVADRSALYLQGGALFVTSRILVVDLLMNRVPAHLVTGVVVWKAHKILESCQEAFILRLYRQKNKTGFIKALSNNALSFTQGFCQVSRVMRNLFVRKLYLCPRFHVSVCAALAQRQPEVVELHLRMTSAMQSIQSSLVDIVTSTVHELRLANKGFVDNDMLTPEWALSPVFERVVTCLLQPVWEQLSTRVRSLIADLRLLRTLNSYLTQYDCVTFYNLTSSLRTTERALQSSGWMMLPPAETLFLNAKQRVFGDNPSSGNIKKSADAEPEVVSPEVNPKWECLCEVLQEVRASAAQQTGPLAERCLVVAADDSTAQQLHQVLAHGSERILQKIFYSTLGVKLNLTPPPHLFDPKDKKKDRRKKTNKKVKLMVNKRETIANTENKNTNGSKDSEVADADKCVDGSSAVVATVDDSSEAAEGFTNAAAAAVSATICAAAAATTATSSSNADVTTLSDAKNGNAITTAVTAAISTAGADPEPPKLDETITLTQIQEKYQFVGESSESDTDEDDDEEDKEKRREEKRKRKAVQKEKYEEKKRRRKLFSSPLILVQSLKNYSDPFSLPRLLREVQPRFIILYDCDLDFIRQVEVWQAECAPHQCLVYMMVYKGTTEEQLYLTQIKREKDAFEYLIKEKASLVFPEDAEGRTADHPDLERDPRTAAEKAGVASSTDTRKGGQQQQQTEQESRIIVDMREFRCELPSLIHKRGIEIEPVTIEVGDYILSPDMCVERKSLSDLVGSLNSGRLYTQATAMTRHYAKPMLLIEFDQNKPFHLQASVLTNARGVSSFGLLTQGEPDNRDVSAKLQLLTLHFPRLRLLWCSSPYATAEMFHVLKAGKEEPDVTRAQAVKSDGCPLDTAEKYNPAIYDFMSKLPGVTTKNIDRLLSKVQDLPTLLTLNQSALTDIIGNSTHAAQLHAALHATLREEDIVQDVAKGRGSKGKTRRGLPKFSR